MACSISKHTTGSSNISGSLVKSVISMKLSATSFSGSGYVYTFSNENGNAATETSPMLTSDTRGQF